LTGGLSGKGSKVEELGKRGKKGWDMDGLVYGMNKGMNAPA